MGTYPAYTCAVWRVKDGGFTNLLSYFTLRLVIVIRTAVRLAESTTLKILPRIVVILGGDSGPGPSLKVGRRTLDLALFRDMYPGFSSERNPHVCICETAIYGERLRVRVHFSLVHEVDSSQDGDTGAEDERACES